MTGTTSPLAWMNSRSSLRPSGFFLCWFMPSASFPPKVVTDAWRSVPGPAPPVRQSPFVCHCSSACFPSPTHLHVHPSKGSTEGRLSKHPFFSRVRRGHCIACTCWVCGKESVCFSFQFTINVYLLNASKALPRGLSGKESTCQCRRCRFNPWVWEDPLEKEVATHSESACNAGDPGSIPGSGRCPRERNIYPLQYSCLENPMDRGAWWATVHGIAKSWT